MCERIKAILAHQGAAIHFGRKTAYATDPSQIRTYFDIQRQALGVRRHRRTFRRVAALAEPQMLVEVEATAVVALVDTP